MSGRERLERLLLARVAAELLVEAHGLEELEDEALRAGEDDLPAVLKVTGSRHGTYLLKMSRSKEGVIMEKLPEKA